MYRNCVYENRGKKIHLWTWDDEGNRIHEEHDYQPYIMLEDKNGEFQSIYGTSLKKKEFRDNFQRNKFTKESGITKIYENLPPYQQYLIDNFWHSCESDGFSQYPLKICFLDIECPSPPDRQFPEPETAEEVINLLTVYDSLKKEYVVFGLKPSKRTDIDYRYFKSEESLLKGFIEYFSSDYPDVICGYNSNSFDIPYLMNRIAFTIGEEYLKDLSPIGRYYEKTNPTGKFGMPSKEYVIEGISCLDYYVMYQKFAMEKRPSYKLDYIGEVELGERKVEYEGSLWDLARDDWERYIDYNIQDVKLLVDLDKKLDYISLLRFLAYTGLTSLENAIKTVPCMNGAIAIKARERGEYIPTFQRKIFSEKAPGGFVAEPKKGFATNVVYFDANSLYPSVMISLNLSPETKIGRVEQDGDIVKIHHTTGRLFELSKEKFVQFLKHEEAALSKAGFLFSQKKVGLIPQFLDNLYSKRKEMKGKMLEARKNGDKDGEKKYDTIQYAYKIHLNSLYGYTLNKYAPMGDFDIGSSVTLTGQAAIKRARDLYVQYLKDKHDIDNGEDYYIYSDTDSVALSLKWVETELQDGVTLTKGFEEICDEIEDYINRGMTEWAKKTLRSKDPRFVFKREAVCDSAIFVGKKYYVLHMLNDEGVDCDKFKYKGVDVVKTTMPEAIKPHVKNIIETMILTRDRYKTNELFMGALEVFKNLDVEKVAKISGMNNYEEYCGKCNGLDTVKGMPNHLKAAYYHDLINQQNGWIYEKFKSGDKVKILQIKTPNRYNIPIIGFKGHYPKEYEEIFTIDYELMFNKIVYAAIERFYDVVGWNLRKPTEDVTVELEDIFG